MLGESYSRVRVSVKLSRRPRRAQSFCPASPHSESSSKPSIILRARLNSEHRPGKEFLVYYFRRTIMRLSGLQKEVLGLYRQCLRESRKKPQVSFHGLLNV